MQVNTIDYQEERVYAGTRLILLVIFILGSFFITTDMVPEIPFVRLVLGMMILFSLAYNALIARKPELLVSIRKNALILIDLLSVTLFILIFKEHGIYLFALYVLIVMQSSLFFGIRYAYSSLGSALVAWIVLYVYSSYWSEHYQTIIAFGVTTVITSLFALRFLRETEDIPEVAAKLAKNKLPKKTHDFLNSMPDREDYRKTIQAMITRKKAFNLLFVKIDKFKKTTDKYGQDVGEYVLEETAMRLKTHLQADDFLARLGTEEFVIINHEERGDLRKFLKVLEDGTNGNFNVKRVNIPIDVKIGVSLYPEDGHTVMLMSKAADDALLALEGNAGESHMFHGSIHKNSKS